MHDIRREKNQTSLQKLEENNHSGPHFSRFQRLFSPKKHQIGSFTSTFKPPTDRKSEPQRRRRFDYHRKWAIFSPPLFFPSSLIFSSARRSIKWERETTPNNSTALARSSPARIVRPFLLQCCLISRWRNVSRRIQAVGAQIETRARKPLPANWTGFS